MARDRNLVNAFDDCVERLSTGESLDTILKDYPESADYLRDLLMISEMVSQVHNEDSEVVTAQDRGRERIQQALKEKPKRASRSKLRSYKPWAAVATIILFLGVGLFLIQELTPDPQSSSGVAVAGFSLTATQLITEISATAIAQMPVTINPDLIGTPLPLDPFELTSTQIINEATAFARGELGTPTPYIENFDITATALFMPPLTQTPPPTLGAMPTVVPPSQLDIIPTSVGSMAQATFTPVADDNGVNGAIKTTSMPTMPPPSATTTATFTPTPAPSATLVPAGTQVADGSLINPLPLDNVTATPIPALIPLNAGEIDDNAEWDTYLLYRRNFLSRGMAVYDIDVSGRQIITVVDTNNNPILGAKVSIFANDERIAETLTYATGKTLFLPNIDERSRGVNRFRVVVEKYGVSQEIEIGTQASDWQITLPISISRDEVQLDVLFLIDTTSSMGDEIMQLQNNILHISNQVDMFADNIQVRYGLLLYREHNNFEYLTRRHDFTDNVSEFQTYLNAVTANSGDNNADWDEALNVALDEALNQMTWRDEDTIKLVFLVADARPHINHPLEPVTYDESILTALARGIKIHPIASSGLEPAGKFIFRQIAQVTMGHFLFLTYDNGIVGGAPGADRPDLNVGEPETLDSAGEYTVNRLADLVLRLIQDEIRAYQGRRLP